MMDEYHAGHQRKGLRHPSLHLLFSKDYILLCTKSQVYLRASLSMCLRMAGQTTCLILRGSIIIVVYNQAQARFEAEFVIVIGSFIFGAVKILRVGSNSIVSAVVILFYLRILEQRPQQCLYCSLYPSIRSHDACSMTQGCNMYGLSPLTPGPPLLTLTTMRNLQVSDHQGVRAEQRTCTPLLVESCFVS